MIRMLWGLVKTHFEKMLPFMDVRQKEDWEQVKHSMDKFMEFSDLHQ